MKGKGEKKMRKKIKETGNEIKRKLESDSIIETHILSKNKNDNDPVPNFPLIKKAQEMGIKIKMEKYRMSQLGSYDPEREEIVLNSPEPYVFFHELAHAVHCRLDVFNYQYFPYCEIVADLSAAILCKFYGIDMTGYIKGQMIAYLESKEIRIPDHIVGDAVKIVHFLMKRKKRSR